MKFWVLESCVHNGSNFLSNISCPEIGQEGYGISFGEAKEILSKIDELKFEMLVFTILATSDFHLISVLNKFMRGKRSSTNVEQIY